MSLRIDMAEQDEHTLAFWLDVFAEALKRRGFRLEAWLLSVAAFSLRERKAQPQTLELHVTKRAPRRGSTASTEPLLQGCRFDADQSPAAVRNSSIGDGEDPGHR